MSSSLSIVGALPPARTAAPLGLSSTKDDIGAGFAALLEATANLVSGAPETVPQVPQPLGAVTSPPNEAAPANTDTTPLGTLMDALVAFETGGANAEGSADLDQLEQALDTVLALLSPGSHTTTEAAPAAAPVLPAAQVVADSRASVATDTPPAATPPAPALQPLADAIKTAAKALDPQSPLASKLVALADSIEKGGLDVAALARLGFTSVDDPALAGVEKAIAALLSNPAPPPAPVASPDASLFAKPQLAALADEKTPPPSSSSEPSDAKLEADAQIALAPKAAKPDQPAPSTPAASGDAPKPDAANAPAGTSTDTADGGAPATSAAPTRSDALAPQRPAATPYPTPAQPVVPQVAFEIARQVQQGTSRFQIRLDPLDLGRIDVDLNLDKTGATIARLTVERAETLDLLKRDQQSLEKALAQAGLDQQKTTLEFSLRQDNPSTQSDARWTAPAPATAAAGEPDPVAEAAITTYRGIARPGGLDILA